MLKTSSGKTLFHFTRYRQHHYYQCYHNHQLSSLLSSSSSALSSSSSSLSSLAQKSWMLRRVTHLRVPITQCKNHVSTRYCGREISSDPRVLPTVQQDRRALGSTVVHHTCVTWCYLFTAVCVADRQPTGYSCRLGAFNFTASMRSSSFFKRSKRYCSFKWILPIVRSNKITRRFSHALSLVISDVSRRARFFTCA